MQNSIDAVVESLKAGKQAKLPTITLSADKVIAAGEFNNPYAAAKAYAALVIAEQVAGVTTKGCFVEQDPSKYIPMVAAGHEMIRVAANLADEAREIEKHNDTVLRTPHAADGAARRKIQLGDKPA